MKVTDRGDRSEATFLILPHSSVTYDLSSTRPIAVQQSWQLELLELLELLEK